MRPSVLYMVPLAPAVTHFPPPYASLLQSTSSVAPLSEGTHETESVLNTIALAVVLSLITITQLEPSVATPFG